MTNNIPPNSDDKNTPENPGRKPKKVKHLLIGSPEKVWKTIIALYGLKYAYPNEWSTPEPTGNPGEIMTSLIRYFYVD
ncbi:MAG: hypothetical protein F6J90_08620 [Moorea sp. SIOASIH]|uniref:hypothetical protein n=1 Tax=Moorena sp. SIOASIH TaxID=2607817 RepID=UPI0013B91536|nr:hypothetical protein [Moorena sp. SIOASIH]NEO36378.1 hypothetical protein [Moorena sp. SIOASIH]